MPSKKPTVKIVVVCGPTGAGKTSVAIELAKRFGGEIVSADSQAVWRHFDIGTAKPTKKEREEVRHHLIDVVEPTERFDAAKFVALADAAIKDIASRGLLPIVTGGTGMYIKMLVHGMCDAPTTDKEVRARLLNEAKEKGVPAMHEKLSKVDPESAVALKKNDTTRVLRALEIFEITGVPASQLRKNHNFSELRYDAKKFGIDMERARLYGRIEARVDKMIEGGLVDEAKELLKKYGRSCQPFSAVGYKEIVDHISGEISLDEAARLIKRNTRHLAKRQLTWFRADKEIIWRDPAVDTIALSR